MPYSLKAGESVSRGIKRVVKAEISFAIQQLTKNKDRDDGIHEARKSVKKIRGALRMVRPAFEGSFADENRFFADTARGLSGVRDAAVLVETFDQLIEQTHATGLSAIRKGLVARQGAADLEGPVRTALESLQLARLRVEHWDISGQGFEPIRKGLHRTYKQGRQAFKSAFDKPSDEQFHESRKRVKDLWYQVRLLENVWRNVMEAYESSLKQMQDRLGDDHNLVLLAEALREGEMGSATQREKCLALIKERHKELRASAKSIGARIYEEKPKEFVARIEGLWDTWQAEHSRRRKVRKSMGSQGSALLRRVWSA